MKKILLCFLLFIAVKGFSQDADTSEIYFDLNAAQMSSTGMRTVDSLRFSKVLAPGHKTMVYGFADYLGDDQYNKTLTAARAKHVKEYLISLGMDPKDIIICEGKGRIVRTPAAGEHGLLKDRKVTIITDLSGKGLAKNNKAKKEKTENTQTANNDKSLTDGSMANERPTNSKGDKANGAQSGISDNKDPGALSSTLKTKKSKTAGSDSTKSGSANAADHNVVVSKTKTKATKAVLTDILHNGTTGATDPNATATKAKIKKTKTVLNDSLHNGSNTAVNANSIATKAKTKKSATAGTDSLNSGFNGATDASSLSVKPKAKKIKTALTDSLHNGTGATDPNALATKAKMKNTKTAGADSLNKAMTSVNDLNGAAAKAKTKKAKVASADSTHNGTSNTSDHTTTASKNKKTKNGSTDSTVSGTGNPAGSNALAAKNKVKADKNGGANSVPNSKDAALKTQKTNAESQAKVQKNNAADPTAIATSAKVTDVANAGKETASNDRNGIPPIDAIDGKSEMGQILSSADLPRPGITPRKPESTNTDSLKSTTKLIPRRPEVVVRKPEKDIPTLNPAKLGVGEIVPLNDIYFAPASNEMLRQSEPSLERLYKFLKDNDNLAVEIEGRICCLSPLDGTDEPDGHGSTRSTARAKNIYDYLVTKGIDKKRVTYTGLGNTKPTVYPEKNEMDRGLNRRPVMKIIRK